MQREGDDGVNRLPRPHIQNIEEFVLGSPRNLVTWSAQEPLPEMGEMMTKQETPQVVGVGHGKAIEHWDVLQQIGDPRNAADANDVF